MPNPRIAQLIAARLMTGLPHPGDPENHVVPSVIRLPGFNTTGMQPEQAEQFIGKLGQLFGEAIVNVIEGEGGCDIVPKQAESAKAVAKKAVAKKAAPKSKAN